MNTLRLIQDDAVALRIDQDITESDVARLMGELEPFLAQDGNLRALIVIEELEYESVGAFLADIKAGASHIKQLAKFSRVALVSDARWLRAGAVIDSALIPGLVIKPFKLSEVDAAQAWVLADSAQPMRNTDETSVDIDLQDDAKLAVLEVVGRPTRALMEARIGHIEDTLEGRRDLRLLGDYSQMSGIDVTAAFSNSVFGFKETALSNISRYAVYGAPRWASFAASTVGLATSMDIKSFEVGERDAALAWLQAEPAH